MRNRALRFAAYGLIGVVVGLVVAAFDRFTVEFLLLEITDGPLWVQATGPLVGLVLAAVVLRFLGFGMGGATSEELIRAYHARGNRLALRYLPGRLLAGAATMGFGGALGLEGPSLYAGGTIGASVQQRLRWLFADKDNRMLMVAGAAAGVAAVFKTPATGVLFALEVPYQGDVARRALLPALIASATSYLTFVTFLGTDRIFDPEQVVTVGGVTEDQTIIRQIDVSFDLTELAAAAALGAIAGLGALLFARLVRHAKRVETSVPWWPRVAGAGLVLGALAVASHHLFDAPLTLGPEGGETLFNYVVNPQDEPALALLLALFAMRLLATMATMAGGGVGGIFIPLALLGLVLGRIAGEILERGDLIDAQSAAGLFPAVGIAAFLGAGYRTPLASIMFVAESTGQAGFVVPALIAAAVGQVVMGGNSVSAFQRATRIGHLEARFRLPISAALLTDVQTVPPDRSVQAWVWDDALPHRLSNAPVVDGERYCGMVHLADATEIDRAHWSDVTVGQVMRTATPTARLTWDLGRCAAIMEEEDLETLAVVGEDDRFLGVVTDDAILRLDEIIDDTRR